MSDYEGFDSTAYHDHCVLWDGQHTVHEKNHLRTFECSRKINSREVGLMQNIIKRMREIIAQYRARSSRNVVRDGDLRTYVPKKGLKVIINVQVLS